MNRDEIRRFPYDVIGDAYGPAYRLRQRRAMERIVNRWHDSIEDPFRTRTDPPTYEEWKRSLTDDERWSHCTNHAPHPPHTHTIVFNEGPYPDVTCVGTPRGLRPDVPLPPPLPASVRDAARCPGCQNSYDVNGFIRETIFGCTQAYAATGETRRQAWCAKLRRSV